MNVPVAFTVDDAFELEDDDRVQVYGSTHQTSPRTAKRREPELQLQDDYEMDDRKLTNKPTSFLLPSPAGSPFKKRGSQTDVTHVSIHSVESTSWLQHPKIRENWRVVLGAFMLTLIGSVLFFVGLGIVISPNRGMHSLVFFIGGLLCLIPGAYHVVYMYLAAKGFDGYSLYNLPVFN